MNKVIGFVAATSLALVLTAPAFAQDKTPVVDGNLWMTSSMELRKAFLVGAGNMIALEVAYAKKKGTPMPVAGAKTAQAMKNLSLDEVSSPITQWYEKNPDRHNLPVMGVLWADIVAPTAGEK